MTKADEYKKNGFIAQKQKGYYAMRIRTRAGNISSEQLRKIAELAEKYGLGRIHFTTRQAVEMHGVAEEHYQAIMQEVLAAGLLPAVCGPRLRTIVACPGGAVCRFGITDTVPVAEQLDKLFVGCQLPSKTKLNISGCPNSCAKPQESDLGLQGAVIPVIGAGCVGCGACTRACKVKAITVNGNCPSIDTNKCVGCGQCAQVCAKHAVTVKSRGFNIFAGGKIGRRPGLGEKIFSVVPEDEAVVYIDALLRAYRHLGCAGERIAQTLARVGIEHFVAESRKEVERIKEGATN